MSYTYDITTSKKDNRSTVCLTICHLLFTVIQLFLSTFLIAHIYSLTDNLISYTINVSIYQISHYIVMAISYFLFSVIVDKTNRIGIYRLGNIINTVLVVITVFYGKDLAKIIVLAGALNGLARGAYYASYNVLKQEMVSRKSMKNFAVAIMVLTKVVNIICPILLGMLIDISTFSMVAIYVLIICLVLIIISFFIKAKRPKDSNFKVMEYIKRLKENEPLKKKMKKIYLISFFQGAITVLTTLLSISVMTHFGSNFSLGALTSVFAVVSIILLFLFNRFSKKGKRNWYYILNSISVVVSVVIFAIFPNITTLIIYHLFIAVSETIIGTVYDLYRNKNLKEAGFYQDIAEHQFVVETMFRLMQIPSYGLLILICLFNNFVLLQVALVVFVCLYSITSILLMYYEKTEKDEDVETK